MRKLTIKEVEKRKYRVIKVMHHRYGYYGMVTLPKCMVNKKVRVKVV
jgi:hypothetical protein